MDIQLKLFPINNTRNEFNILINKVESLAYLATTLTPVDSFSEIDGYTTALWEEMQKRKFNNKELFLIYDKLIHATNGFNLLKLAIQLFLVERDMRFYGVTGDKISYYDKLQIEYQILINELKK